MRWLRGTVICWAQWASGTRRQRLTRSPPWMPASGSVVRYVSPALDVGECQQGFSCIIPLTPVLPTADVQAACCPTMQGGVARGDGCHGRSPGLRTTSACLRWPSPFVKPDHRLYRRLFCVCAIAIAHMLISVILVNRWPLSPYGYGMPRWMCGLRESTCHAASNRQMPSCDSAAATTA